MAEDEEADRFSARARRYANLGVSAGAFAARAGARRLIGGESAEPAPARHEHEHEAAVAPAPTATDLLNAGIPFTSEAERVLEEAAAEAPAARRNEPSRAAPAPEAEEEVRPVTERPANPRRGWWQRLTQS